MRPKARPWFVLVLALAIIIAFSSVQPPRDAPEDHASLARVTVGFFSIGWYDSLKHQSALPSIAKDGMNASMPYYVPGSNVRRYLDTAARTGVKVMLEIDRSLVREGHPAAVAAFVTKYKTHRGLWGWYLADEPSTNRSVGPLSPGRAERLYAEIKRVDKAHPVAIAFSTHTNYAKYRKAMDVVMLDDYPFGSAYPEYSPLPGWRRRMLKSAAIGAPKGRFLPVVQAFGGKKSPPGFPRRLPTPREERYMVFSSLAAGASGIYFWTRYRTDEKWVDKALVPVIAKLKPMYGSLKAGPQKSKTKVDRKDVTVTVFRDPHTGKRFLLAIHHKRGTVIGHITLDPSFHAERAVAGKDQVDVSGGRLEVKLGSYEPRLYKLE
jgi:hypothetical protein